MSRIRDARALGVIAWTRNDGRFADIGRVLGVTPKIVAVPALRSKWLTPLRYLISFAITAAWLARRRPRLVIVSSPPPFAGVLIAAYALLSRGAFILDAHPGAFGHRDKLWRLFVPVQKLLVRLASATMVTEPALAEIVRSWGGNPLVFHEAPPRFEPAVRSSRPSMRRPKVVFTTIFDPDEPLGEIAQAACLLKECDVTITGEVTRMPQEIRRQLLVASHVQLTGWLDHERYLTLVAEADVVVALTTDPHSVMRSAFEAAYLQRVTVLSDTPPLRTYFSPSVFVKHTPAAIVRAVRGIVADPASWEQPMRVRHQALMERWVAQRTALESAIEQARGRRAQAHPHPHPHPQLP